jgi:hypothetical protein
VWRSLHQAVGTGVWLATVLLAVIARRGSRGARGVGTESTELRRPVAAATAAAMLAVDPGAAGAEAIAPEAWTEQPPAAEASRGVADDDELAAAGIIVIDETAVERSTVELTALVEEVEEVPVAVAPAWEVVIAESSADLEEWVPDVEPVAVEDVTVEDVAVEDIEVEQIAVEQIAVEQIAVEQIAVEQIEEEIAVEAAEVEYEEEADEPEQPAEEDEDEELDANAAALAEIERIEAARAAQSAAAVASAIAEAPAPATRRPPTLAVIIARGADF